MKSKQVEALVEMEVIRHYLDSPHPSDRLSLNFGFARVRVLDAGLELGVFTVLAGRSRSAATLAEVLGCSRDGTERLLDALVEFGLLEKTPIGYYAVTPLSETYLVRGSSRYLRQHLAEARGST